MGFDTTIDCPHRRAGNQGRGGFRLTEQSHKSFISAIKSDLEDATKVGKNGIIIIAPWSYRINALLRIYFEFPCRRKVLTQKG
jgi:hypothetical protein